MPSLGCPLNRGGRFLQFFSHSALLLFLLTRWMLDLCRCWGSGFTTGTDPKPG